MTTSRVFKSIILVVVAAFSFTSFSCDSETSELFQPSIENIQPIDYDPIFKEKPADPESFEQNSNLTQASGERDAKRNLDAVPQEKPHQERKATKEAIKDFQFTECKNC
jgi:hypothetical protein